VRSANQPAIKFVALRPGRQDLGSDDYARLLCLCLRQKPQMGHVIKLVHLIAYHYTVTLSTYRRATGVTVALIGSRVLVCYAVSTGKKLQIFRKTVKMEAL